MLYGFSWTLSFNCFEDVWLSRELIAFSIAVLGPTCTDLHREEDTWHAVMLRQQDLWACGLHLHGLHQLGLHIEYQHTCIWWVNTQTPRDSHHFTCRNLQCAVLSPVPFPILSLHFCALLCDPEADVCRMAWTRAWIVFDFLVVSANGNP